MPINRVQAGAVVSGGGGNISCTPGGTNVVVGHTILLCIGWDGNDGVSPLPGTGSVDNLGNTFTLVKAFPNTLPPTTSVASVALFAAPVTVAGASTTTVQMQGVRGGAVVLEYSGLDNSGLLDQFAEITASVGTSLTTPNTPSTTNPAELLLAIGLTIGGGSTSLAASGSFTMETQGATGVAGELGVMDEIVASTGTYAATMTGMASGGFNALLLVTLNGPPTYSLSGNCGVAGATVTLGGAGSGSTTADGSGNFSFSGLGFGGYTLTPSSAGSVFFQTVMARLIAGASVTNGNFGFITGSANTYTQRAYDSADRANENPINSSNWNTYTGYQPLQIVSHLIEASSGSADCGSYWSNATWPTSGQFIQLTIDALGGGVEQLIYLLYSATDESTAYYLILSITAGHTVYTLETETKTIFTGTISAAFAAGDIVRLEKSGAELALYYNNVLVTSAFDTTHDTGYPGVDISTNNVSDVGVLDFVAGSIVAPTFSISGNAGHAGATVNYTGPSSGSVTADGSGNYTITGLIPGPYVITPSFPGHAFAPTSQTETLTSGNITGVNFTATQTPTGGGGFGSSLQAFREFINKRGAVN